MTDWLKRFEELSQKENGRSVSSDSSDRGLGRPFQGKYPGDNGDSGDTSRRKITPPFDADGVPCGMCPSCHRGEFWRWPRFHPDHKPNGWVCWFCSPPPEGSGPCDFCGVPEPDPFNTTRRTQEDR